MPGISEPLTNEREKKSINEVNYTRQRIQLFLFAPAQQLLCGGC